MARPRDVVMERPRILFVGINPGETSGKVGHHFAGPGNPFWRLLHAAGLTPIVLRADEDSRLVEFGYGLVNLCTRPTKTAAELTRDELARGAKQLRAKVRDMQPEVVALVGVTLYPIVVRRERGAPKLLPGPGPKPDIIEGARLFVVPNPSGLNASFPTFDAKLPWFRQLALFAGIGNPSATSK
ncbi:MAG TPA: mismatch-specific DNA-glycosylase [Kofleriaceae bacterium]